MLGELMSSRADDASRSGRVKSKTAPDYLPGKAKHIRWDCFCCQIHVGRPWPPGRNVKERSDETRERGEDEVEGKGSGRPGLVDGDCHGHERPCPQGKARRGGRRCHQLRVNGEGMKKGELALRHSSSP